MSVIQPCTSNYSGKSPEDILEDIARNSSGDYSFEPVSVDTITSTGLDGDGTFDLLMRTVTTRIQEEFNKNRITGSEYAKVYLGAVQSTLQQAITFELQNQLNNLQAQQLTLANETAEINKYRAAVELATADLQREQVHLQNEDLKIQVCLNKQQLNLLNQQESKGNLELDMLGKQLTKLDYENQLASLAVTRSTTELTTAEHTRDNTKLAGELTTSQKAKLDQDVLLSKQKLKTEKAQTTNSVDGIPVFATKIEKSKPHPITGKVTEREVITVAEGIIGKQQALYFTQRQGFARDAEYKVAKLFTDTWAVRKSQGEGGVVDSVGVGDTSVAAVLQKAREGISAEFDMVRPSTPDIDCLSKDYSPTCET